MSDSNIIPMHERILAMMREYVGDDADREYIRAQAFTQQLYTDLFMVLDGNGKIIYGKWNNGALDYARFRK